MAILSGEYEPELNTTTIGQRFMVEAGVRCNGAFYHDICSIDVLEDKLYEPEELVEIIKDNLGESGRYIKLTIDYDDNKITIEKRYALSKHSKLNAKVIIHYKSRFFSTPASPTFYVHPHYVNTTK